jgi:serine/threonine-protein kinase
VHDYAGKVDGGGASLAISIYDGKAIAYVCGGSFEVWFTGTAKDGKLALSSRYGATLTATYDAGGVHGLVVGSGRHWTFTSPTVKSPSGLYRAYTKKQGVKVQATWIVLPDGSQTGAEDAGGDTATAAPVAPIDFGSGTAVLPGGQTVQPTRIDGSQEGS